MGLGLYFETGEGPRFKKPVQTSADIRNLTTPDVSDALGYVFDAVSLIRRELDGQVPLIGFAGSPLDRRYLHGRRSIKPGLRDHQGAGQ